MSNKSSDDLFQLIKSLSKPEKRYFKLYASRHTSGEKNNYIKLFEACDKQKDYDEERLKQQFADEAFIHNFSIAKSRLYQVILRSLDGFHYNSSIDVTLKRMLHAAEILYKKSLYKQSHKQLRSAKKLAYKHEKHTTLLEIFSREKALMEKDNYMGTNEASIDNIYKEDQRILGLLETYATLWHTKSLVFSRLNKRGKARTKQELTALKKIVDTIPTKPPSHQLFPQTAYLYHHIYSAYYFGIGDHKNSLKHLEKNRSIIDAHVHHFKEEPNVYFSVLTNTIYIHTQLQRYDEAFKLLEQLQLLPEKLSLQQKNTDLQIKLFSSAMSIRLSLHSAVGEFEKGLSFVAEIKEFLKRYRNKITATRKAYFYFAIAALYFSTEDAKAALKWINRLLNRVAVSESEDIYCFAKLLSVFIHLELGNKALIPYELKSTQRYLKTRNRVYRFESLMLDFIPKLLKTGKKEDEKAAYLSLLKELKPLRKDTFEKTAFAYFDFYHWVVHKTSEKSFAQVIKEQLPGKK